MTVANREIAVITARKKERTLLVFRIKNCPPVNTDNRGILKLGKTDCKNGTVFLRFNGEDRGKKHPFSPPFRLRLSP